MITLYYIHCPICGYHLNERGTCSSFSTDHGFQTANGLWILISFYKPNSSYSLLITNSNTWGIGVNGSHVIDGYDDADKLFDLHNMKHTKTAIETIIFYE